MKFSLLVNRIGGEGATTWLTHYEAVAARERGEDVIILSVGDPELETPAPVVERAVAQLRGGDTHYVAAAGRLALRQAIARAHTARCGQAVGADNVVFVAGAQNALFITSLCLAGPGDEVVTFEPLYPTYPATIEVSGARLVRAPPTRELRPDVDALAALITPRTRAILWASPNNPSGIVLNESELAAIAELARRHDLWLVVDEVYAGLAPGGRVPSLGARLPERVVTLGSLSKSHAMTGWRAGWLIGPRELTVNAENLAMCMLFGMPGFIQEAAVTALAIAPGGRGTHARVLRDASTALGAGHPRHRGAACARAGSGHVHADRRDRQRPQRGAVRTRPVRLAACVGDGRGGVRPGCGPLRARVLCDR